MKKSTLLLVASFLTSHAGFSDTYVWEDYDDFSGSNLDSSKWDFSCWDGGNLPVVSNGRALLAGKTNYSWNDTIATDRMRAVNQNAGSMLAGGEPHSVLEFRESDELYGIELELTLPSDIPTDSGIGIYAIDYDEMFGGDEEQSIRFDLDLWYSGGTPEVQVTWKNPTTGAEGEAHHIAVSKGVAVKLAFIRDDENIEFFCNDVSVASSPYQNVGETFIVRTVNENGYAFSSYIDNVRVLRRADTTSLDGTVLMLSSTDGVSETLSFENGTFTSTFQDPTEGTFVDTDKSYILDEVSSDVWSITLDDGDTYSFDASTNSGTLVDYENGVIDAEGTWSFAFERHDWEDYDDFSSGSLDSSKWDVWWGAGGELPIVVNGALKLSGTGNESFSASSVIPDDLTYASNLPSKHSVALINQDDVYGMQAEFMIPANPSDDTGLNFIFFDWATDGSALGFGPELEYRVVSGLRTEFAYTDPESGQDEQITRPAEFGTYYKMSLIHTDTTNSMYLNGELIEEFSSAGFEPDTIGFAAFNDDGLPYATYVKNVRVLRRSQDTTEPDPVTVVSDPNGKPVVVQVGDEYQWNSTLDGVTLWLVGNDSGSIMHATIKYEASNYSGNFEFLDEVTDPIDTLSYAINENGYLAHTESLGQQYFQILSAEDGRIGTIGFMNDLSLANHSSEPANFFFTTRAAAEEYYYSKVNPKNWMWFDHYPWVYSEEEGDWLYFYPSGGTLMYWSNKGQAWRQFN